MRAAIVCLLLSVVAISADLQSDIEDVNTHLPIKEIISIGKQYVATYPGYADGLRYVDKVTYEKLVKDFLQTKEGQELIDYFQIRGINAESFFLYMTKKSTEMISKWLEPIEEGEDVDTVISGDIMADYRNAIAKSDFFEAVHEKEESSPEFANLVAAIKDPQYRALFYRVSNSKGLIGHGKSAEVRGFWKKVAKVVVVGAILLG